MPELPEVEFAAKRLRSAVAGRVIARLDAMHPSQQRHLPADALRAAEGLTIDRVERRAKIQLVHLQGGAILEVHFRMTGDWEFTRVGDQAPRHERVRLETADGVRVSLVDSRALGVVRLHAPGTFVLPAIGPEPLTDDFTADGFRTALARRSGPIKPALLDQKLVAGVGNIYASEALWEARIHPATAANTLSRERVTRLRDAIRHVLETAPTERYYGRDDVDESEIWRVYGRDGEPCRRCGATLKRLPQAGRSTFYCPRCQRR
ncbi:bifunctional DNA-formamidopyrimidine glycosylase/DNA-(apurinic or apyrimidinic site) lyase [Gemmatimonas sp.]|jgi:formamidopyrimidine-DNA glycosylase|uniref:bifunctional DNA-formamidopyrimidine glycosylase/DNA-(apurinic or apyrimidinic site) lyase n=1 Tax=Gemmatimonas sp. TaxID=1962908 RepID=UPI0037C0E109